MWINIIIDSKKSQDLKKNDETNSEGFSKTKKALINIYIFQHNNNIIIPHKRGITQNYNMQ